ncbi:hypothetical protein OCH239_07485 [Roseivivax halodurans JCM 10272]|uniref:HdeA n=1 Tax=Roseivivax halodurans JCM 10272 TaxID=1449350 RepID=X7EJG1_9RHOB|nr:HdeA/HdeB family chaperone [Roseivivax halodurans]ETX16249.1 hypothetical protein OCH239_07485 [Roseivivax halodurans JCM 10272]
MKTTAALIAALGLTTAVAAPAFAQEEMDVAAVTCAEFDDMDDAGKMAVAEALVTELESMENVDAAMVELEGVCDEPNNEDSAVLTALTAGSAN